MFGPSTSASSIYCSISHSCILIVPDCNAVASIPVTSITLTHGDESDDDFDYIR